MLTNVRQDDAPVLRHDRRPGVIVAAHDRAREDFEAKRVVTRFATQKSQRLFSTAATKLRYRQVAQRHACRASVEAHAPTPIREKDPPAALIAPKTSVGGVVYMAVGLAARSRVHSKNSALKVLARNEWREDDVESDALEQLMLVCLETLASRGVAGQFERQDLECDRSVQSRVSGRIHLAHAPGAKLRDDLVGAQSNTRRER